MVKSTADKAAKSKSRPEKRRKGFDTQFREVPTGSTMGVYSTVNQQGQQIGWYVVVGSQNITIGGYTWLANQAYWFWWVSPFPDNFAITPFGTTPPTGLNPAYASPVTTAAPFDTSTTVTPATLNRWWQLSISGTGTVGAMGMSNGVTQYWYETQPNAYLPVNAGEVLTFSPASQPTAPMYQAIDQVL